ncbi:anti-sigma factor family protein [Vulgatibacter incomptus]|uniref:Putative transmembrane anti-sigma factor n=1 Tax=Vulgatibacter incomptus TaxID=1391653 RepID=A0A0K1PEE6_9BACT|nr:hypothetical protein [Vulgatibacter incomptus]AKU91786.1 putative transmembrane anti-sigma factor [Vulgatibacter incomptus]
MSCVSDEVLSAMVDGEAGREHAAHLRRCDRCRGRLEKLEALDAALRSLPLAREAPSSTLAATLRGLKAGGETSAPAPGGTRRLARRARSLAPPSLAPAKRHLSRAVAGLAAMAAALAVMVIAPETGSPSRALAEDAVANHIRAFTVGDGTGCQVESQDPSELSAWLSTALGHEVEVPMLAGATLIGARRCSLLGEETAAVVYRAGDRAVSVYLPPKGSGVAAACEKSRSGCVQARDGQTVCVIPGGDDSPWLMVGAMPGDAMCSIAASG